MAGQKVKQIYIWAYQVASPGLCPNNKQHYVVLKINVSTHRTNACKYDKIMTTAK